MSYRKILCSVDFSETSRAAMRAALDIAAMVGSVTLVHVFHLTVGADPSGGGDTAALPEGLEGAEDALRAWTHEARESAPAGVKVDSLLLQGAPADQIVEQTRAGGFDLVVLGTHGRTGLTHALLGSVAEQVVRHAPGAVLVVRPTTS